jgi:hypothetical protein
MMSKRWRLIDPPTEPDGAEDECDEWSDHGSIWIKKSFHDAKNHVLALSCTFQYRRRAGVTLVYKHEQIPHARNRAAAKSS